MAAATDYITSMPRVEQERKGCIRTYTGLYVNPLRLRAREIRIEDIAHHLANICRYTGACPVNYNVAHHSVLVSDELGNDFGPEWGLAGLLHDAAEAYFNDIASPVKRDPRMKWYRDLEHQTTKMIFCVFGLRPDMLDCTKPADDRLFRREVQSQWGKSPDCYEQYIEPWSHELSEIRFLNRFHMLRARLQ